MKWSKERRIWNQQRRSWNNQEKQDRTATALAITRDKLTNAIDDLRHSELMLEAVREKAAKQAETIATYQNLVEKSESEQRRLYIENTQLRADNFHKEQAFKDLKEKNSAQTLQDLKSTNTVLSHEVSTLKKALQEAKNALSTETASSANKIRKLNRDIAQWVDENKALKEAASTQYAIRDLGIARKLLKEKEDLLQHKEPLIRGYQNDISQLKDEVSHLKKENMRLQKLSKDGIVLLLVWDFITYMFLEPNRDTQSLLAENRKLKAQLQKGMFIVVVFAYLYLRRRLFWSN